LAAARTDLAGTRTDLAEDRTKLAVTRTVVALERTLMAWIRTSTSLITFGFSLAKFFQGLEDTGRPVAAGRLLGPRGVGLVMIGLGVGALALAALEHHRQRHQLETEYASYGPFERSVALGVAAMVSGLGIFGFALIFLHL
jgi:putative membrane protein